MILYCLHGQFFVHFDQTDQQIAVFRHFFYFDRPDAVFAGVESRTSSPVRIWRDEQFESELRGLYPCGEGAGYAGGITSAAMDGVKVAEAIARRYRLDEKDK